MIVDEWKGMYPSAWKGIITPESFSHPAKFSSRLIERIYQHGIECGWLHEGSRIVDCFGGVGLGAWPALRYGMDWTGCELEPRFVTLAQANIDAWNAKYSGRLVRWGTARIIQGDSRHLAQVIGAAEACISSPPFVDSLQIMDNDKAQKYQAWAKNPDGSNRLSKSTLGDGYGSTPGNLGNLPPGNVAAVISSPPYAESMEKAGGIDPSKSIHVGGPHSQMNNSDTRYGHSPGQLASLPPGAPPFDAAISSPPFERTTGNLEIDPKFYDHPTQRQSSNYVDTVSRGATYGETCGNIGNDNGDTFWSAAREIVAQVYQVLAPGAHAIWVVKSYVKNKQLVEFPHQWQALCEACGFVTLHEHHALLVRHGATSIDIDGNHHEHKTESKSFFRRLAEKNGSPRIDYETVLCMVKPGGEGGGWDGAISSPPYADSMQGKGGGIDWDKCVNPSLVASNGPQRYGGQGDRPENYGTTPGQLGALPPGSLDDVTRHGK